MKIDAVFISTTPKQTHFPMARVSLKARKHVVLEKPISLTLTETDELIELAESIGVKFTIGYSQRFNPKFTYLKKCPEDGTLGEFVCVLISRHIARNLGNKISRPIKLSPAAMEATHDIDFILWCLEPARPIRVYALSVNRVMKPTS